MRKVFLLCASTALLVAAASAASKPHVVAMGRWTTVKLLTGMEESIPVDVKIRPLLVDGHTKEFTIGNAHDVTDRMFVVQRVYRLNDLLPEESGKIRWRWEPGGWLLVDRISGRAQTIALPEFDAVHSEVRWFRDYAAYCGASDDGSKAYTVVAQLGKRKPLLKKALDMGTSQAGNNQPCATAAWSRSPARVTFEVRGGQKFTFTVRSHAVDLVTEEDEEGGD
jgi:hypothetical protein